MDPGLALVEHLYAKMQIDPEWSVREPRGFTWWAHDLAQRIWADEPVEEFGDLISRVHAQTDLLEGFEPTERNHQALALYSGFTALSGFILGAGRVRLAANVYVHDGTLQMWRHVFTIAALTQVAMAHRDARPLCELTGSAVAVSAHPRSGPRAEPDDMLNVIEDAIVPIGALGNPFVGRDFTDAKPELDEGWSLMTMADPTGLTAEFPFGRETALLQMGTDEGHPLLGPGMSVRLTMPGSYAGPERNRLVLDLNTRECSEWTRPPFLGSWCAPPEPSESIVYASFFPSGAHLPGLARTLGQYSASRSRWLLEDVEGGDYEESARIARPAMARFLFDEQASADSGGRVPPAARKPKRRFGRLRH